MEHNPSECGAAHRRGAGFREDPRFSKPFSPPYISLLRLTQAHSNQGLREKSELWLERAEMSWREVELSTK